MSATPPLSEQDRANLVAFLDGELTGEAAREMEARIQLDPRLRAEAESLKRTWDLLDFLPRPEPSPRFAERTLSRVVPVQKTGPQGRFDSPASLWSRVGLGLVWAAAVLFAAWMGFRGFQAFVPREPGDSELTRDLRLIENKRFYDLVDDLDLLEQLNHPDLFGEDSGG